MDTDIAKAGWLQRQSSVLRRWKRNWFVLRKDGDLLYFETPNHPRAEERIVVRARVQRIKFGFEMESVPAPEGCSRGSLFSLVLNNEELVLCAESTDDMRAWQIAIEEARVMNQGHGGIARPPAYNQVITQGSMYPGQVLVNTRMNPGQGVYPPGTVIYGPNGETTVVGNQGGNVVYVDGYPRYRRYDGSDVAMGMVAGAALGTMMWGPMLWW